MIEFLMQISLFGFFLLVGKIVIDGFTYNNQIKHISKIYGQSAKVLQDRDKPKNEFIYSGDDKPKRFEIKQDDNEYPEGWNL